MTREEEITQQAKIIAEKITKKYANNTQSAIEYKQNVDALIKMAKWADEHPSQELKRQIVNKAVEWIKENITYTDNGIKKCLVNLGPFIDAIMEE